MLNQPNYYAVIPSCVRYCKELEPCARLLYGEITALTSKEGYCWASNQYFAELYDTDERTVKRWIAHLQELGFIHIETEKKGMGWDRKIYIIQKTFTKGQKCPVEEKVESSGITVSTGGFERRDKNVPYEGTKMSPYYYTVNNTEEPQQGAAVSSENSKEKEIHEAYLALDNTDIPYSDRQWISQNYTSAEIIQALKVMNHPETKINTSKQQFLKWALKEKPEIPKSTKDILSESKEYVKEIMKTIKTNPNFQIQAFNSYVEITPISSGAQPYILAYTEKGFKDQLINALKKYHLI